MSVLPLAEIATASYGDSSAARRALKGVQTLFMVSATESFDRVAQHRTFITAAVAAGVRHIVYTSIYGAAPDAVFTFARHHWATEQQIQANGLRWTFLRNNLYLDSSPCFRVRAA
ncbi:hypothetical protein BH23ACT1_BH23ACT1_13850 [soil metagenome]